ncbi:hypothetical protein SAMN05443245_6873 [Paraburkholderia fungorum]|uniref:WYL domain-containing protein n=1 Tax=Paraburkholderia fungorum TaxID=134537 RepID=A0A1H1JNK2_9BURK|nr:hypothetical protein [Paraburkholderia fungorum]SDR51245.1 hypothetical protein SAMN05443245_6873 [Paraburkholderia fungorum]
MNPTICSAIKDRQLLELRYHGFSRVVEPYAYGRDKNGDAILRCFQISGGSESGQTTGWKILKVAAVFAINEQQATFTPRTEYRRGDKAIAFMFCQL